MLKRNYIIFSSIILLLACSYISVFAKASIIDFINAYSDGADVLFECSTSVKPQSVIVSVYKGNYNGVSGTYTGTTEIDMNIFEESTGEYFYSGSLENAPNKFSYYLETISSSKTQTSSIKTYDRATAVTGSSMPVYVSPAPITPAPLPTFSMPTHTVASSSPKTNPVWSLHPPSIPAPVVPTDSAMPVIPLVVMSVIFSFALVVYMFNR